VAPLQSDVDRLVELQVPLQDGPRNAQDVLAQWDTMGSPAAAAMAGGRFFGFVIGGTLPVALSANWLATAWDKNAVLYGPTPGLAAFEQIALDWVLGLLGLPADAGGAFVTGATQANLCGLAAARHAVLMRAGWDVGSDGLFGAPPITVLASAEAHPTLFKALGLLGLDRKRVVGGCRHQPARDGGGRAFGDRGGVIRVYPSTGGRVFAHQERPFVRPLARISGKKVLPTTD